MKNVLLFALLVSALNLFAQNGETVERKGFVIGLGISGGVISISDSNSENPFDKASGGLSLPNLKLGMMLSDRVALLATFPGMIYEYDGKDRSFEGLVPAIQYWVDNRWWVSGGVGLAIDAPAFYEVKKFKDETFNFGCAVTLSSGYELHQNDNFTIDLQSKIHLGRVFLEGDDYRDGAAFSVGIGFTWY